MLRPFTIGIGGGTGGGKTTIARALCRRYASRGVCLIEQDSYYLPRDGLSTLERQAINYDEPSAIDHDLFYLQLECLARGQSIAKPIYCFTTHTRLPETTPVEPAAIIVVEGLFALWDPRVRSLLGLKVYADADADLRFIRRLRRDVQERGRTTESVVSQYLESVRPMHRIYVDPTKKHADLIVDTTQPLDRALAAIDDAIQNRLQSSS